MTPENPREVAILLQGAAFGAFGCFVLAGLAMYFDNVKRVVMLKGYEFERNRRREETR